MNKNYTPYIIALAFAACAFQYPGTAKCQDLTDAQRLERCQNNKNRIAELESQLQVVNADLSASMTKKEMDYTKEQLAFVRLLRREDRGDVTIGVEWDKHKYDRISAQHNFKYKECEEKFHYWGCLIELQKIITKKINKAMSLNRPALVTKQKQLLQQLATHRNNLIALRCDEQNTTGVCTMVGKWVHDTEGIGTTKWTITSDGTATEEGKGYAKGKAAFDGKSLRIDWQTTNGYSGYYKWTLDSNCSSEDGELVFKTPITSKHKSTVRKTN